MKIKKHKKYGQKYITFKGKHVSGQIFNDGSGELYIKNADYFDDSSHHSDRIAEVKKLADLYTAAYKELKSIKYKIDVSDI